MPRSSPRWRAQLGALVLALAAAVLLLLVPSYTRSTYGVDGEEVVERLTLLEVNGAGALLPVLLPVVLAGVPLLVGRRWVAVPCTFLLVALCGFGLAGVGYFFVPAAAAAVLALFLSARPLRRVEDRPTVDRHH